jgi:hypothetical protein
VGFAKGAVRIGFQTALEREGAFFVRELSSDDQLPRAMPGGVMAAIRVVPFGASPHVAGHVMCRELVLIGRSAKSSDEASKNAGPYGNDSAERSAAEIGEAGGLRSVVVIGDTSERAAGRGIGNA